MLIVNLLSVSFQLFISFFTKKATVKHEVEFAITHEDAIFAADLRR